MADEDVITLLVIVGYTLLAAGWLIRVLIKEGRD